ncbi:hypothetical protein PY247_10340 [Acinetobacter proteolyticus]|nr:hypothetical protein [Acinetobacter proteolyticus]WEI20075.1 hypothetical protein PY247_10340 [Acinetobacter proteolyticus]
MRLFSKLCVAVCSSSVLLLTGCQHLSQPNKVIASPQVQDENNFSLQGKIGVRTPQQSGSAFLHGYSNKINLILSSPEF